MEENADMSVKNIYYIFRRPGFHSNLFLKPVNILNTGYIKYII